jgi:DNA-binding HxlR family transcriptional regulator
MTGERDYCYAFEAALDELGGKWKPLIIWILMEGKLRFSEINRNLSSITERMLTRQLRELEKDGLVNRKVFAEVPPKVEYSLTEKGKCVMPILEALCDWGEKYSIQK